MKCCNKIMSKKLSYKTKLSNLFSLPVVAFEYRKYKVTIHYLEYSWR